MDGGLLLASAVFGFRGSVVREEGETAEENKRQSDAECVKFREPGDGFQG
jgi:hypothetical protein